MTDPGCRVGEQGSIPDRGRFAFYRAHVQNGVNLSCPENFTGIKCPQREAGHGAKLKNVCSVTSNFTSS